MRGPVLAAWGFTANGAKVLLHLMAGSKEDTETVSAFSHDMRARGLGDPLPVLKLMFAAMIRASERWRALRVTGFERRQMDALRRELDQDYEAENDIRKPSADMRQKKLSSIYRT